MGLLRHGLTVTIVDAPESGVRVGETLPPPAETLLAELGLGDRFLARGSLASYGTRAVWGGEDEFENEFILHPNGRGWHLDRRDFDAMLLGAAVDAGARLCVRSRAAGARRTAEGWRLTVTGDTAGELEARFVVDATGRSAWFATSQGARKIVHDRLAGIFGFFSIGPRPPADTYTLVEACEHGWWYSAPLPGATMVVAFLSDTDLIRARGLSERGRWLDELASAPRTARRVERVEPAAELGLHGARSQQLERVTGDGWLATGDAAAAQDPLSSQGILNALRWGILASHAIRDHLHGVAAALPVYERLVDSEYDDYLAARAEYYAQEHRWQKAPFWARRREAIMLDPGQILASRPSHGDSPARLRGSLGSDELELLRELCSPPRAAHEVVTAFNARSGRVVDDRRLVLALQDLERRGVIATPSPPR